MVLVDATGSKVNNQIKVPFHAAKPSLQEAGTIVAHGMSHSPGAVACPTPRHGMLKFDIIGAHRLVKKPWPGWRFLALSIDGEYWCHTVGTVGEGSADSAWARLYSASRRMHDRILVRESWGLVSVDDGLWWLPIENVWPEATFATLCMVVLGPLGWRKVRCGASLPRAVPRGRAPASAGGPPRTLLEPNPSARPSAGTAGGLEWLVSACRAHDRLGARA